MPPEENFSVLMQNAAAFRKEKRVDLARSLAESGTGVTATVMTVCSAAFWRMAMVAPWADWTGWGCVQPEGRFSVKWSVFTSSASAADAQRRIPRRQVAVSVRTFCI